MTLSHCWGGCVPLRLLRQSFCSLLESIPPAELSKSFQDAMVATKRLGLRYLWIDSLCIIQDSQEDWERESAMMDRVYQNSWCNIAATRAINGQGGCFAEKLVLSLKPCKINVKWNSRPNTSFYCWNSDLWKDSVDDSALLNRAGFYKRQYWLLEYYISAGSKYSGIVRNSGLARPGPRASRKSKGCVR